MRLGSQLNLPHNRETAAAPVRARAEELPRDDALPQERQRRVQPRGRSRRALLPLDQPGSQAALQRPREPRDARRSRSSMHTLLLENAPCHLGISPIEIDYLDVLFGFDLGFGGNHDEIIAESLFAESPLTCLTEEPCGQGGRFSADGDGRPQRGLPPSGPHRRRHPHQQLSGPHRRLFRRRHQRLSDRPPILGRPAEGADGKAVKADGRACRNALHRPYRAESVAPDFRGDRFAILTAQCALAMLPPDDEPALIRRCADRAARLSADLQSRPARLQAASHVDPRESSRGRRC